MWSPDNKQYKTDVIKDNNNPIFYQTIEVPFKTISKEYAPPIVLNLFDKNFGIHKSDDFIGRAVIPINEA